MKKISIALASMLMAGHVVAADFDVSETANNLDAVTKAQTVTVTTSDDLFIVNPFNFTVSAGVGIGAIQDSANLGVSAGAIKGRTVFSGHSNGGSVSQCGEQTVAGSDVTPDTLVAERLDLAKIDACSEKDDITAAPTGT